MIFVNVCFILTFFIYTNITSLFVIIKKCHPRELAMQQDVVVQAPVQEHGANTEYQFNDPMEEEVDVNNTIEEDGRNILIEETFNNVGIDDDEDPLDGVFDIHVLDKVRQTLH